MWIDRMISGSLLEQSRFKPALLLTGARQTGKSSLLRRLFPQASYLTLDVPALADEAEFSPTTFLERYQQPVIIDEIQYVPKLFRELKIVIDRERNRPCQFLLTGSQQFPLMQGVSESLAGRISIFDLSTLAASELRNAELDPSVILQRGGFPELWVMPSQTSQRFFDDYIMAYLERDLRSILAVDSLRTFDRFLRALALRTGNLLNLSELGRDIGVTANTIGRWMDVLVASGIIFLLEPWYSKEAKRLVKTPKLFFRDNGILCHLLRIHDPAALRSHAMFGNIWENFVFNELLRHLDLRGSRRNIWFWREKDGSEIDFVIENDASIALIEAKTNERPDSRGMFFSKFRKNHEGKMPIVCAVACQHPSKDPTQNETALFFNPLFGVPSTVVD